MNSVNKILEMAKNGIPQALARFNDGEVGIISDMNFVAARGDQKGSLELQLSLSDAIRHEQERYWKGYPCPVCMPNQWQFCLKYNIYNSNYKWNTLAVVNTNRNYEKFAIGLQKSLIGKRVVWVSGRDQNLDMLKFDIVKHITVKRKNSYDRISELYDECKRSVRPGYVFLFSCGPSARVLVKMLYEVRPDATFLDIGSTYDPITRNVWHKCHMGTLKKCKGCN